MKSESLNKTQEEINKVWSTEAERVSGASARELFHNRLFVEGYPVFKDYIPREVLTILDIGASSGRYAMKFAQDYPKATIFATDIVDSSLELMRVFQSQLALRNLVIQKEDASALSFQSGIIDCVYSGMVLQGLPDVPAALREMHRVLKPGGTIIVSTVNFWNFHTLFKWYLRVFNRPKEYYGEEIARSPKELRKLFEDAGFEVRAVDGFYPAYGIYRLKTYWKPAGLIGKILNRINRLIDPWTGRFLSRHFGFEIFVVATKRG
jgi:SAM-dependent methyltransferase